VQNADGTMHDIPALTQCTSCHAKLPERILSFSAFQLSHSNGGETMASLSDAGWLSTPAHDGFNPPGNAQVQAALGYLHANCGNCHNSSFDATPADPQSRLRLLVGQLTPETTDTYQSMINVVTQNADFSMYDRVEPGKPALSEIILRMGRRPPQTGQMPPIGTEVVDSTGVAAVTAWIQALPP